MTFRKETQVSLNLPLLDTHAPLRAPLHDLMIPANFLGFDDRSAQQSLEKLLGLT
jgi:hypothetical protein